MLKSLPFKKEEGRAHCMTGALYLLIHLTFGATLSGRYHNSHLITEVADIQKS